MILALPLAGKLIALVATVLLESGPGPARATDAAAAGPPTATTGARANATATATATTDHPTLLLVLGAPGSSEYGSRFAQAATRWQKAAGRAGAASVVVGPLEPGGSATGAKPEPRPTPALDDRQRLQQAIDRAVREPGRSPLWLVLIGHGTHDGRHSRFNLRGPDLSASELAGWLKPLRRPLVFIHTGSASAPFLRALSGEGRILVTATRSGSENNSPRFGGFFAQAISDQQADLDGDGGVSLLEAFLFASKRVEASFAEEGLLASEHALLEDNGDGLGTSASFFRGLTASESAVGDAARDGARARQMLLVPAPPEQAMSPALRQRRDRLERAVFALREQRSRLPEATYFTRLERLLTELARLYQQAERDAGAQSREPARSSLPAGPAASATPGTDNVNGTDTGPTRATP